MERWKIVYWFEHKYDASFDEERGVEIWAKTKGDAIDLFRQEEGDYTVLSVSRYHGGGWNSP